jgi:hypothetical protein
MVCNGSLKVQAKAVRMWRVYRKKRNSCGHQTCDEGEPAPKLLGPGNNKSSSALAASFESQS